MCAKKEKRRGSNGKDEETHMAVVCGFVGSFPFMQPGDTYLLMLNHSTLNEDGYASTALHCSFFYVTEENTVYPSYLGEAFQKYNGMPVEEFARVIHKHWKGYATAF